MTLPTRVLAAIVAALLVAGLAVAVVRDDEGVRTAASSTSTSSTAPGETTTTTATPTTELERGIAEIEAFVAKARGLPFKAKVKVALLDDAAFRARLKDDSDIDREQLAKTTKVLRALDLLEEDDDLEAAYNSLLGDAVLGFYDFETDEMVVRGASLTPGVRQTLAHELTHALQDQHFELDRPELEERDDEAEIAFTGLVEGDARRIEHEYADTLSAAERRQAQRQTSSAALAPDIPQVLIQSVVFPYVYGPPFAERVVDEGGQGRIDEAFRSPPLTSEHIIHPEKFLRGEQPRAVPEPPAEGPVFDRGVIGEFGLVLIFGDDLRAGDLRKAVNGWGGDRYVAWEADGRVCVRATFEMDTAKDADELRSALRTWAGKHRATADNLTLTSCR
ncbi:MAG TPA: hypothetical protein VM938_12700 [Acidimicrobiales bacterium]|nr:hypothetical protein [Acidimicrobiales bacterium]